MKQIRSTFQSFYIVLLAMLVALAVPGQGMLLADGFSDHRTQVGLKLFRTLVAADQRIAEKIDANGAIVVSLVYVDDRKLAEGFQTFLAAMFKSVGDVPVQIEVRELASLNDSPALKPAAIFIVQPLRAPELQRLVQLSVTRHMILFSPFEGDVEQGVLAGLSVQATVRPLINMRTLKSSQLDIKPFFLKVANQYE